jgi:GNAT superfamily N-acetyltransferase
MADSDPGTEATRAGVTIRDARPGDTGTILRLLRDLAEYEKLTHEVKATEDALRAALFGPVPRAHALIADLDGQPVGFALWYFRFSSFACRSSLFVEDVFVTPAHRGEGIGRAIFANLARRASTDESGRMEWQVLDWNAPSIAFYRGLGARPVEGWTTYAIAGEALAALAA